jgi:hypothetical protein
MLCWLSRQHTHYYCSGSTPDHLRAHDHPFHLARKATRSSSHTPTIGNVNEGDQEEEDETAQQSPLKRKGLRHGRKGWPPWPTTLDNDLAARFERLWAQFRQCLFLLACCLFICRGRMNRCELMLCEPVGDATWVDLTTRKTARATSAKIDVAVQPTSHPTFLLRPCRHGTKSSELVAAYHIGVASAYRKRSKSPRRHQVEPPSAVRQGGQ